MRGEADDAAAATAAIILVGERHVIVVDGDKPRIGDRRAMRVAGEIGEHARGSAERRLGVDDERALPQRADAVTLALVSGRSSTRSSSSLLAWRRLRTLSRVAYPVRRLKMRSKRAESSAARSGLGASLNALSWP